jgi:hypothetical protein
MAEFPGRPRAVRLSPVKKRALEHALGTHKPAAPVWRQLVACIEDGLSVYRDNRKRTAEARRVLPQYQRQLRQLIAASRQMRRLRFPRWVHDREMAFPELLFEQLTQLEEYLGAMLAHAPGPGRPQDPDLIAFGMDVVEMLVAAGVPDTLGRKTVIVNVLGLVRQWARGTASFRQDWRSIDYEFAQVIVRAYRKNSSHFGASHPVR